MNVVPADRVIAVLTQELADAHREMAILKVQVAIMEEESSASASSEVSASTTTSNTSALLPNLPPLPSTSSVG